MEYVWPNIMLYDDPGLGEFAVQADVEKLGPVVAAMVDNKVKRLTAQGNHSGAQFWRAFRGACMAGLTDDREDQDDLASFLATRQMSSPTGMGPHGWTPVHCAAVEGRMDLVRELISL